jgi:hypothetical protein
MFKTTFWAIIVIMFLKLLYGVLVIYLPLNPFIIYCVDLFFSFYLYLDIYFIFYYLTFEIGIYYGFYIIIEPSLLLLGFLSMIITTFFDKNDLRKGLLIAYIVQFTLSFIILILINYLIKTEIIRVLHLSWIFIFN